MDLGHRQIDGSEVVRILESLNAQIETIEELQLLRVNWNTDHSVRAITEFIANAPKLKLCDIREQLGRKIRLERKK